MPGSLHEKEVTYSRSTLEDPSMDKSAVSKDLRDSASSTTPPSIVDQNEMADEDGKEEISKPENEEAVVEDDSVYLHGMKLGLVMMGLSMAALLVGLDNAILATAIPTITTAFNSLEDVGWYGSAFLMTVCALQPLAGKLFTYFDLKWTYLSFLFGFEVGSLICATAINSEMLIIGRAVAGCGAAGLFSGALVIVGNHVILRLRPLMTGVIVAMFGISNVVGPLLGAVFTEKSTWRWCFYINLPLGAVTAVVLLFFFNVPPRPLTKISVKEKLTHLDLPGLFIFVPAIVMILLAMQWGGHGYAWNSATIIGLFVGFALTIALFCFWQWRQQEEASIPPRIFLQRSVWSACAVLFFGLGSITLTVFYLPMWFQVILKDTPIQSGVRFLPLVLANLVMSIVSGGVVTTLGFYNPWLFLGSSILAISSGIFSTWKIDESNSMIIGLLILAGAGSPLLIQMPIIGLMALIPEVDLPIASGIGVFFQFLGGAIFLGIAENIFVSRLKDSLAIYAPDLDSALIVGAGAVGLHKVVADIDLPRVVLAYNDAITGVFYLGIAGGVLAFLFSFGMKWATVKGKQVTSAV